MWIPSKLTRPGRLYNAILRPRVLDMLQQAPHYKLVMFRSPAGYGKTTMRARNGWPINPTLAGLALMTVTMTASALLTIYSKRCIKPRKKAAQTPLSLLRNANFPRFVRSCPMCLPS